MEWYAHTINSGYRENIFLPSARDCYFCNQSDYFYCYDQIIGSYVRIRKSLPIWKIKDSYFNKEWSLQTVAYFGYPVFTMIYSSKTYYLYWHDKTTSGIGQTGMYIYTQLGYPCGGKYKLQYDSEEDRVATKEVWEDCWYRNSSSFSNGMTFTGKGSYEGQTLTINFMLNTSQLWVRNSSTPWGEYVPYNGTYGDLTANSTGNHYLGCKYWSSSSSVPDLSKDTGYISTFYLSPKKEKIDKEDPTQRFYDIPGIQHQYDAVNKKHRWIIWANRQKTAWYENNEEYPIKNQNYTYKYYSNDGKTKSDLTLTYKGLTNSYGKFQTGVFYYEPCRMY